MQCERNRTVVEVKGWSERVTRDAGILSLGSCFSMEIGNKLAEEGYGICSNPFGVLYNPASIANSIDFLAHGRIFTDSDVVPRNTNPVRAGHTVGPQPGHRPIAPDGDGYVSFYHHGSFTRKSPEEFLLNANTCTATRYPRPYSCWLSSIWSAHSPTRITFRPTRLSWTNCVTTHGSPTT